MIPRRSSAPQLATPRVPRPVADRRSMLAVAVLMTALVSTAALQSAPGDDAELFHSAIVRAADRLVELQKPDGSWPTGTEGPGDVVTCGRPARALLSTWRMTAEPSYLAACSRTAKGLESSLRPGCRAASTANLLFLAEFGRATRRPELVELAAGLRQHQLGARNTPDGISAARELIQRPNRTKWMDGAWRNYLLWHGGEVAELARAVGDEGWADAFSITLASSWAPKHDFQWWTMGAGRVLEILARVPGAEAQRLASAETATLLNNQLVAGLPWNDTPYDSYLYAVESSAALRGLLTAGDAEARRLGREGAAWVALHQQASGGWPAQLSLAEGTRNSELSTEESAEVDADVLMALLAAARSTHSAGPVLTSGLHRSPALAGPLIPQAG